MEILFAVFSLFGLLLGICFVFFVIAMIAYGAFAIVVHTWHLILFAVVSVLALTLVGFLTQNITIVLILIAVVAGIVAVAFWLEKRQGGEKQRIEQLANALRQPFYSEHHISQ